MVVCGGASGRTIFCFFASGKEEIQPSRSENGRMSESERTKKKKAEGHKWLWAFGFSASSRGVRRQTERAGCCTFVEHAFHYTAFFFSPPPAFFPLSGGDYDPSAATIWSCQSSPSASGVLFPTPRLALHADDARGRTSVLPTSSDERSAFPACFVFNEAVGGGYGGAVGMWSPWITAESQLTH